MARLVPRRPKVNDTEMGVVVIGLRLQQQARSRSQGQGMPIKRANLSTKKVVEVVAAEGTTVVVVPIAMTSEINLAATLREARR